MSHYHLCIYVALITQSTFRTHNMWLHPDTSCSIIIILHTHEIIPRITVDNISDPFNMILSTIIYAGIICNYYFLDISSYICTIFTSINQAKGKMQAAWDA